MISTDTTTIGGRVWAVREEQGLSRKEFSACLGCPEGEITNVEFNKLKKPEQKESLYRNIAVTFGVSLNWIKTGEGDMHSPDQVISTDLTTVGGRIWAIRKQTRLSRRAFGERLGVPADEIRNIEFDRLKRPELKESFYRNVSAEFNVSLDWIKTGKGDMYATSPNGEISAVLDALLAFHDPTFDTFVAFYRSHSPERRQKFALLFQALVALIDAFTAKSED